MKIKKAIELADALSNIKRYSQFTMCRPESVLEHCGFVSMIALCIGRHLKERGHDICMGMLLEKAIMHDADESVTGDIARPVKYHSANLREKIYEMEAENMKRIADSIGLPILEIIWDESKDGVEGAIVGLCDVISVVYKCYDECHIRKNLSMTRVIIGVQDLIDKKINHIHELLEATEEKPLFDVQMECAKMIHLINRAGEMK